MTSSVCFRGWCIFINCTYPVPFYLLGLTECLEFESTKSGVYYSLEDDRGKYEAGEQLLPLSTSLWRYCIETSRPSFLSDLLRGK